MIRWRWVGGVLLAGSITGATACGSGAAPAPVARRDLVPSWPDVFDGVPDLYGVIRPRALKRDGIYGAFWNALLRAAQARGFTRGSTMVEAAEGAEEIIAGLNRGADAALIFRGVAASLDPASMHDADGHPLFRAVNERGKVAEYALIDRKSADGSLFVLPDRTWVGALGEARGRARQAFAAPLSRPPPAIDPQALAAVRVAGPLTRAYDRHPILGLLTRKLASATFTLLPGKGGLVVELLYTDEDAVARAEMNAKRIVAELSKSEARAWLRDAKVDYQGRTVVVRMALPPRLLEELPSASGADLSL